MPVLIVVAHPDDEVFGCGATAAALAAQGISVRSCILSSVAEARQHRPEISDLLADTKEANRILGLGEPILGQFPNIAFNTVSNLTLVQFVEAAILETKADVLFTHHPSDLNNDHLHTSLACQCAARLFQRRPGLAPLKALYYMEVLSSTDWSFPGASEPFRPDTFFEIGGYLERKLQALAAYRGVLRDFPHPRSNEIVRSLAAFRGGQSGMQHAEAFQTGFRSLNAVIA